MGAASDANDRRDYYIGSIFYHSWSETRRHRIDIAIISKHINDEYLDGSKNYCQNVSILPEFDNPIWQFQQHICVGNGRHIDSCIRYRFVRLVDACAGWSFILFFQLQCLVAHQKILYPRCNWQIAKIAHFLPDFLKCHLQSWEKRVDTLLG